MAHMKPTGSSQLLGIQYLRATAALMVVLHHSLEQIPAYAALLDIHHLGGSRLRNGVDLFFVISGFIMVLTSSRASPGDFAMRRIIRIVPLYWLLTTALLVALSWMPYLFNNTVATLPYAIKSFLFIPYPNPGQNGLPYPILVPGWSLNLEMFFYAIFALMLFLPARSRLIVTAGIFICVVACAPLLSDMPYGREIEFYGNFKLFEFLFGMAIAQWYVKGLPAIPVPVAGCLALGGLAALFLELPGFQFEPGNLVGVLTEVALPAVVVVFAVLCLEPWLRKRPAKFLAYLGDASYSMYLSHIFMLGAARFIWIKLGFDRVAMTNFMAFEILGMGISIVGAVIVYRCLELPLHNGIQGAYKRLRKSVPPATAIRL
jgi:exopolysaccharide production protein ExoZ